MTENSAYEQLKVSILLKNSVVQEIDRIINDCPELYHNRSHFVRRGIFLALKSHRRGDDEYANRNKEVGTDDAKRIE